MLINYTIEIVEVKGARSASARLRNGVVEVKLPLRLSALQKQSLISQLVGRLAKREARQTALLEHLTQLNATEDRLTFPTQSELEQYVCQINAETFNRPELKKVRIGSARHSRLAQVNRLTGVITISRFCLRDVPAPALRYLVIHELAHFLQPGHPPRFWQLVAQFCPDYKLQRKIITAHHQQAALGKTLVLPVIPANAGIQ